MPELKTHLSAIDTELQQGHLTGDTCQSTSPSRESVPFVGIHADFLRPHIGAWTDGSVDHHEVATAAMPIAMKVFMVQAGIRIHVIGSFVPKVGIVQVCRSKAHIALFEVTIHHTLRAWSIAFAGVGSGHRRRSNSYGTLCGRKPCGGRPLIIHRSRSCQRHRLTRLDVSRGWVDDDWLGKRNCHRKKKQNK